MKQQEHLKSLVKEMLATEDKGFTNWEIEFLDNMFKWNKDFSDRQEKKIECLYKERM